ncbi:protein of unknown function [Acetoanaerobium sticklandii]|uniref:Uncharacterized protein n=1 Tax=Acetoanaerobium sticklandii (strain ATCC 12662 / DSM 519 / JCM 1433 / CCUG 9281 / NCIMB 10654 / HF) TaxID=499177 RepID=E3PY85_ACESD|nr:hypothetical protein [Acetoanaerobium sticklandii]CBH21400.1 protein of unknown function [Acetoanaerobium sticklandii]
MANDFSKFEERGIDYSSVYFKGALLIEDKKGLENFFYNYLCQRDLSEEDLINPYVCDFRKEFEGRNNKEEIKKAFKISFSEILAQHYCNIRNMTVKEFLQEEKKLFEFIILNSKESN